MQQELERTVNVSSVLLAISESVCIRVVLK